MNNYDIKRLALILSVQAEIEGMKSENANNQIIGNPLKYLNKYFIDKSSEFKNLAYAPNELL